MQIAILKRGVVSLLGAGLFGLLALSLGAGAPPSDSVVGGGWITGTPSGANGIFAVAGSVRGAVLQGGLDYLDTGNGMHVRSTAITGYAVDPNDATCRIIDYNVTIDGDPGACRV